MFKRFAAVVLGLSIILIAGLTIMSVQSNSLVAQQDTNRNFGTEAVRPPQTQQLRPRSTFGPPNSSLRTNTAQANLTANRQFAGSGQPQNPSNQPNRMTVEMKPLLRAAYLLPADAAESLTKLFAHSATALVECRTEESDDELKGMVTFVVTAEPATQQSIREFVAAVFPESNVRKFITEKTEAEESTATSNDNEEFQTVSLKLPGMT